MPKVQYGIPAGLTQQGLSHEQIAQLLLRAQMEGGSDPSQVAGYDTVGVGGPAQHGPVYSVGQGIANATGDIASAYIRRQQQKQMLDALQKQTNTNNANYAAAAQFATNPNVTTTDVDQATGRYRLPDQIFNGPATEQQRAAGAVSLLGNGGLAAQYAGNMQDLAKGAQPPPPVLRDIQPGAKIAAFDPQTGRPTGQEVSGGPPLNDLAKSLMARGIQQGSPEWNSAMDAEIAKSTGKDALTQAHLDEAQSSAALTKSRLEQLKSGQLDDDAIEFRAHLAAAGDPSAYQGIPKSIYGSVSIAKIGNRAASLAKDSAEAEGLPPEEAARRQAQVNIAFKGAQKAYGAIAQSGAQKDQVAIEMGKLGDQLADASKKVARTGWTDLSNIENYARSHSNNPEYGQLAVAVQGFKTAYAQALVRGGQATDAARSHADELFNTARNDQDLMARVRQAQKEIGAVLESTSETKGNVLAGVGGGQATPTKAAPPLPGAGSAAPKIDYKSRYGLQ